MTDGYENNFMTKLPWFCKQKCKEREVVTLQIIVVHHYILLVLENTPFKNILKQDVFWSTKGVCLLFQPQGVSVNFIFQGV